jgi:hypothetical protein
LGVSYAELLKHPLWQQKRLRVFERAGFACERCGGGDKQLHAHHKTYLRGHLPWDYDDALLECLCDPCHERAHVEKDRLNLVVATQPTSIGAALIRLVPLLAAVRNADSGTQRINALNALQDELDAQEDFRRGPGGLRTVA